MCIYIYMYNRMILYIFHVLKSCKHHYFASIIISMQKDMTIAGSYEDLPARLHKVKPGRTCSASLRSAEFASDVTLLSPRNG